MLLFGYGLCLNLAPIEFHRVVGIYIATLFIVWQIISFLVSRSMPTMPILLGGALIVTGGLTVAFWGEDTLSSEVAIVGSPQSDEVDTTSLKRLLSTHCGNQADELARRLYMMRRV